MYQDHTCDTSASVVDRLDKITAPVSLDFAENSATEVDLISAVCVCRSIHMSSMKYHYILPSCYRFAVVYVGRPKRTADIT